MMHQSRISALVIGAMVLLSSGVSAAEQCPKGEKALEFRFFTDSNSWKDNGWTLECEDKDQKRELVWSIPIGSIEIASHTEVIREAACVPNTSTCKLNIFDAASDGLQGDSFHGWFAFLHGANTVATYKGVENVEFTELSYCVGPNCEQVPQSVHDEDCQDIVYLAMQLDNNPTDTSYQLVCGGEEDGIFDKKVIWNGSGFTQPGAFVEEETCLPKDSCCEFIVVDGRSNGLTDTIPKVSRTTDGTLAKGFIYLENNFEPILEYDGSTGETFGVLKKRFSCPADKQEENLPEDVVVVGDNVEGVFDPEENQGINEIPKFNEEYFIDTDATMDPSGTWPPTSEDWVSDDDYQNLNDDGRGFGSFTDDFNGVLMDDVFLTQVPTLMASDTWAPTWAPTEFGTSEDTSEDTEEREYWQLYDDVVDTDDTAWAYMDDLAFPEEGMSEFDSMIQDLSDHTVKLPSDPTAVNRLNEQGSYVKQKVGLTRNGKIVVGVLVPLFALWTIGLVGCYYYGPKEEEEGDDAANEKGTTGENDSSGSISGSDVENLKEIASVEYRV